MCFLKETITPHNFSPVYCLQYPAKQDAPVVPGPACGQSHEMDGESLQKNSSIIKHGKQSLFSAMTSNRQQLHADVPLDTVKNNYLILMFTPYNGSTRFPQQLVTPCLTKGNTKN